MTRRSDQLTPDDLAFLSERHLATLTSRRADGTPHVVAIAFTFDRAEQRVRIITSDGTQKVRNVETNPWAAVCQVDGRRWLTLEGPATVQRAPDRVARAVADFEARYRPARDNPHRVVIEIELARVMGRG